MKIPDYSFLAKVHFNVEIVFVEETYFLTIICIGINFFPFDLSICIHLH